jgi:sirohydrochlorin ferrochelatase
VAAVSGRGPARPLVVAAHGTADAGGRRVLRSVRQAVAAALPEVPVRLGHLEHAGPALEEAVSPGERAIVVPLFLASGYHVTSDLPGRLARHAPDARATEALGSGEVVRDALAARLAAQGARAPGVGVVLASAGSADPRARSEILDLAAALEDALRRPVRIALLGGAALRAQSCHRIVAAAHLIAPGLFWDRLRASLSQNGIDATTPPLGPDPRLVDALVSRYRAVA